MLNFNPSAPGLSGGTGQHAHEKQSGDNGSRKSASTAFGRTPAERHEAELNRVRKDSYEKIYAHEKAHQDAAGSFGGGIHIDYDANGIAVGGHVPINIPGLSMENAEQRVKDYQQIKAAALAPDDPSGQDIAVAAKATALMGQAQSLAGKKQAAIAKNGGQPLSAAQKKDLGGQLNVSA